MTQRMRGTLWTDSTFVAGIWYDFFSADTYFCHFDLVGFPIPWLWATLSSNDGWRSHPTLGADRFILPTSQDDEEDRHGEERGRARGP